jgi:hypothetical protein
MINSHEVESWQTLAAIDRVDGARELWKLRDAALSFDLTRKLRTTADAA